MTITMKKLTKAECADAISHRCPMCGGPLEDDSVEEMESSHYVYINRNMSCLCCDAMYCIRGRYRRVEEIGLCFMKKEE